MPKIALSKLKPFEKNPRKIDKKELEKLQKRLEKYPDLFEGRPILVNKDYEIFAGNQRYHAAKELGLKEVPVKVIDCSPEDAFRMGTIDNAHSGEWLTEELIELAKEFDTDLTEFNLGADIDKILEELSFGDKNKELDIDSFDNCMELKFKLSEKQYYSAIESLRKISDSKEQALLQALNVSV